MVDNTKMMGEDYSGTAKVLGMDGKNRSTYTITLPHAKVHEGNMYKAEYHLTTLTDASYAEMMIVNGATKELHMVFNVVTEGKSTIKLFEGGTITSNGSSVTVYNMNRVSSNTSTAVVFHTPVFSTTGTLIDTSFIAGGTISPAVKDTQGGVVRNGTEFIFNKSTKYNLSVLNQRGDTTTALIQMQWYEVD